MKNIKLKLPDKLVGMLFLSPSLVGVLIFFILPFVVIAYYSVIDSPGNPEFVWLKNYSLLMRNSAFCLAAKNTFFFSITAIPMSVIVSLVLALILERRIPGRSLFSTIFLSPMMVPVISIVLIWNIVFNYNGLLNEALSILGGNKTDWLNSSYCQLVIVFLYLWKYIGYYSILFLVALSSIPKDVMEAASMDGASAIYQFVFIKLRYLSSTILFVTVFSLINSFKIFREIYQLTGAYPFEGLYTLQHFMNNTFRALDYQKLSAAAIIMASVIIAIVAMLFCAERHFGKDVDG